MRISSSGLRVYLETLGIEDAEGIVENANDATIVQSMPGMPYPFGMEQAMQFIGFARQTYVAKEEFHLGIHLGTGSIIGLCALANIDRQNRKAELGYFIGSKHQGMGYGSEAIRLILGFGFKRLELNRVYARVLVGNDRSAALLDSLGFRNEGVARQDVFHLGRYLDDFTFSILKNDYSDNADIAVTDH